MVKKMPMKVFAMPDFTGIIEQMKQRYNLRIRKWRKQMSGCAWRVCYSDGHSTNWIEAPYPKTPISLAIFLHEVGHHVIGFSTYRVRCEEEYHAWAWALQTMQQIGVAPDARVKRRYERSMQYAVDKALRRGAKRLPEPLVRYAINKAPGTH